jgi:cyclic pyranopterin phosphate synthase
MELTAAINGLAHVPEGSEVSMYSDSEYLVNTMTRNWKRRANLDLWHRLDELTAARKVKWIWVEGHVGHPENERANRLAMEMSARNDQMPHRQGEKPTHFNSSGQVHMVDVSEKQITQRMAVAKGAVKMNPSTLELIECGDTAKGDVLAVAQIAGIMAAKKTSELIPLCHPLRLANVAVEFQLDREQGVVEITATVKAAERTGLEMEALTATAVSALTIYDMCKAVDRGMRIEGIRLVKKTGGKSGTITLE